MNTKSYYNLMRFHSEQIDLLQTQIDKKRYSNNLLSFYKNDFELCKNDRLEKTEKKPLNI
ncbi:hypothetical protein WAF17_22570 (plasmid) [Bernardetia sp. ABR2-2B]|uniref:hypothetical protein n=1 Tax=Bernardetia sp. ABR2-2B TaxID=3127472 RepID=UPI0030D3953D